MAHSHHMHREHQVSHRRVNHILKGEPAGAMEHHKRPAFSKVTSKTAAEHHGSKISGDAAPKKYARGGKVKGHKADGGPISPIKGKDLPPPPDYSGTGTRGADYLDTLTKPTKPPVKMFAKGGHVGKHKGHQTNIIVVPHHQAAPPAGPMAGPAGPPPPGAGLPPSPMGGAPGGPPGMPPPGGMPGMPMRARGGRTGNIDGEATKGNIAKWAGRASKNSYFRGGAATGVGREEKASHMKRKGK